MCIKVGWWNKSLYSYVFSVLDTTAVSISALFRVCDKTQKGGKKENLSEFNLNVTLFLVKKKFITIMCVRTIYC